MSGETSYLRHILEAIEKIERYKSVGRECFFEESHWQDATIGQLELVGEEDHTEPIRAARFP